MLLGQVNVRLSKCRQISLSIPPRLSNPEVGLTRFFCCLNLPMAHPLISQIMTCAEPIAAALGLEVVDVVFQTNKKPPVLRIDVRNLSQETGLEDCERFSRQFDPELEDQNIIPGAYVLEVSSPGTDRTLSTDREFIAFRGFPVRVKTYSPYKDHKEWCGTLKERDETAIYLNQKGKAIVIPWELVAKVQLDDHQA